MEKIEIGKIYKHFKGNKYIVNAIAKNTETMEDMVVYSSLEKPDIVWVRPKSMWFDMVDKKNNIRRFERED